MLTHSHSDSAAGDEGLLSSVPFLLIAYLRDFILNLMLYLSRVKCNRRHLIMLHFILESINKGIPVQLLGFIFIISPEVTLFIS